MKYVVFIIIAISLSLAACSRGDSSSPLSLFGDASEISHRVLKIPHQRLYQGGEMLLFPQHNKIVLHSVWSPSHLLVEVDLNSLAINERLRKGDGPGEFQHIRLTQMLSDSTFLLVENGRGWPYSTNVNNPGIPKLEARIDTSMCIGMIKTRFDQYIGNGIFNGGRYKIYDIPSSMQRFAASYPDDGVELSDMAKFFAYQGRMMINPRGDRFVFACSGAAVFEIYDIRKNSIVPVKLSHIWYPMYEPASVGLSPVTKSENKFGYPDLYVTPKYIYMIFSGRVMEKASGPELERVMSGRDILVFDWNGDPVRRYKTDVDVKNICVADDDKTMYAIALKPDPELVTFRLD